MTDIKAVLAELEQDLPAGMPPGIYVKVLNARSALRGAIEQKEAVEIERNQLRQDLRRLSTALGTYLRKNQDSADWLHIVENAKRRADATLDPEQPPVTRSPDPIFRNSDGSYVCESCEYEASAPHDVMHHPNCPFAQDAQQGEGEPMITREMMQKACDETVKTMAEIDRAARVDPETMHKPTGTHPPEPLQGGERYEQLQFEPASGGLSDVSSAVEEGAIPASIVDADGRVLCYANYDDCDSTADVQKVDWALQRIAAALSDQAEMREALKDAEGLLDEINDPTRAGWIASVRMAVKAALKDQNNG